MNKNIKMMVSDQCDTPGTIIQEYFHKPLDLLLTLKVYNNNINKER